MKRSEAYETSSSEEEAYETHRQAKKGRKSRRYTPPSSHISEAVTEANSDLHSVKSDASKAKQPGGLILAGGRLRLPDRLIEYLNKGVAPEALYWQTGGEAFSIDPKKAELLLKDHFQGMKISSFTRSLNRWGFTRIFHPGFAGERIMCFQHPLFKRHAPELVEKMKIRSASSSAAKKSISAQKLAANNNKMDNEVSSRNDDQETSSMSGSSVREEPAPTASEEARQQLQMLSQANVVNQHQLDFVRGRQGRHQALDILSLLQGAGALTTPQVQTQTEQRSTILPLQQQNPPAVDANNWLQSLQTFLGTQQRSQQQLAQQILQSLLSNAYSPQQSTNNQDNTNSANTHCT